MQSLLGQVMPMPDVDLRGFWLTFGAIAAIVRLAIAFYQVADKRRTDGPANALAVFYIAGVLTVIGHFAKLIGDIGFQPTVEVLAKADVGTVLLFGAVCTAIRIDLHYYARGRDDRFELLPLGISSRWIQEISDSLVYAGLLVFLIIRPFFIQTFIIPSPSMVPTLVEGDILIVDKFTYRFLREPQAGEIVVFKPPNSAREMTGQPEGTDFVKRLIGVPGDIVELRDSKLFRNGIAVNEVYVQDPPIMPEADVVDFKFVEFNGRMIAVRRMLDFSGRSVVDVDRTYGISSSQLDSLWELPAAKLPDEQYLMVGDNRTQSYDGRFWGPIPRHQIVGKSWWRILPINRFGHSDRRR